MKTIHKIIALGVVAAAVNGIALADAPVGVTRVVNNMPVDFLVSLTDQNGTPVGQVYNLASGKTLDINGAPTPGGMKITERNGNGATACILGLDTNGWKSISNSNDYRCTGATMQVTLDKNSGSN